MYSLSIKHHTIRPVALPQYPTVDREHLFGDAGPAEILFDVGPAPLAHVAQGVGWQVHGFAQRGGQRFDADVDPPAAAVGLQALPRSAFRGDDRNATGQRFGDDQPEVFAKGGQYEQVRRTIQRFFFVPVYGTGECKIVLQPGLTNRGFDDLLMSALIGSGDEVCQACTRFSNPFI